MMTPERWENTCAYLQEVFGREDEQLRTLMMRATAAGLPDIAVSAEVGRLLKLLAMMAGDGRGAERIIEVGTLAGYSGIWLARGLRAGGLRAGGKLITIEIEPRHAAFARGEFERAGVGAMVDQRIGAALDVLPKLAEELGPASVDMVFLDGVKSEYGEYVRHIKPMLRPRGLLTADNILGSSWWIDEAPGVSADRDAVDRFNRMMAGDGDYEVVGLPVREGVMVARKRG